MLMAAGLVGTGKDKGFKRHRPTEGANGQREREQRSCVGRLIGGQHKHDCTETGVQRAANLTSSGG